MELSIGDLFQPVYGITIKRFLYCYMGQAGGQRSSMPMLLTGCDRDHITRKNFLYWATPALPVPAASCYDQGLTKRMAMPGSARPGPKVTMAPPVLPGALASNKGSNLTLPLK
jgi:hypothetical protein